MNRNNLSKTIIILLTFLTVLISNTHAQNYSMRRCMVLPITDSAGNSLGYKIYEELEAYLKDAAWCKYVPSSNMLGVFSKYRERLKEHLQNSKVVNTVATRLKTGTNIRVDLKYDINSVEVKLEVLGQSGDDVYFSEKTTLEKINAEVVLQTLKSWLDLYETSIPYDGNVLGVLGEQVTFTIPKNKRYGIGQEFRIKRYVRKKKHKLLKTIVEWDTILLAKGKIFNISHNQALGVIKVYTTKRKIAAGDWVKLEPLSNKKILLDNKSFGEIKESSYGKLGQISIGFDIASMSAGSSPSGGSVKVGGFAYGIAADVETWLTRNYFVLAEYSKNVGNLSKVSGSPNLETASITSGMFKIGGGYKYLPMGFFYGPQVNIYGGWANYSYEIEESAADGFGSNAISGIFVGVGGNMPLKKRIRVFGSGEIIPFSSFSDDDNTFDSVKSTGSMAFKVGGSYEYSPAMSLKGSFEVLNNSAKFSGTNTSLSYRSTSIKLGAIFVF